MNEELKTSRNTCGAKCIAALVLLACGVLAVTDFVYQKHPHFDFEGWPLFYAGYGLLCCLGVALSAWMLRRALSRSEDYYDR